MNRSKPTLKYDDFFNEKCTGGMGTNRQKCEICDREFPTVGIYEIHLQKVHGVEELKHCNSCKNTFKRRMGFVSHLRIVHLAQIKKAEDFKRPLGCDICDAFLIINGFVSYEELVKHTALVHGKDVMINTPENMGRSTCPLCGSRFTYRKGMVEHMQVLHGEHLIVDLLKISEKEKDKYCEARMFKCKHCCRLFTVEKSLIQHMERTHNDFSKSRNGQPLRKSLPGSTEIPADDFQQAKRKSVPSSLCSTTLAPRESPIKSVVQSPAGLFKCVHCQRGFTRQSVLSVHMAMLHGGLLAKPADSIKTEPEEPESTHKDIENGELGSVDTSDVVNGHPESNGCHLDDSLQDGRTSPDAMLTTPEGNDANKSLEVGGGDVKKASQQLEMTPTFAEPEPSGLTELSADSAQVVLNQGFSPERSKAKAVKRKYPQMSLNKLANGTSPDKDAANDEGEEDEYYELDEVGEDDPDRPFYTKEEIENSRGNGKVFYGEKPNILCYDNAGPDSEIETCLVDGCPKKFVSYFSMMRHVAFFHRPRRTASIMKLRVLKKPLTGPEMRQKTSL